MGLLGGVARYESATRAVGFLNCPFEIMLHEVVILLACTPAHLSESGSRVHQNTEQWRITTGACSPTCRWPRRPARALEHVERSTDGAGRGPRVHQCSAPYRASVCEKKSVNTIKNAIFFTFCLKSRFFHGVLSSLASFVIPSNLVSQLIKTYATVSSDFTPQVDPSGGPRRWTLAVDPGSTAGGQTVHRTKIRGQTQLLEPGGGGAHEAT